MIVNKYFLIGLHLLVTYHAVKTFVILSANVDDVKKIAKEFSGPLTDEIVGLILKATKNYTFNASREDVVQNFKSNPNLPPKLKYNKNIMRNRNEPIQPVNYHTDDTRVKETPKYSYYVAPKIHNYAEVKTEAPRIYNTPKRYNVISLSNHVSPPLLMKKIPMETFETQKVRTNDFKQEPTISSHLLNELIKFQNDYQNQKFTPQVPKMLNKISDETTVYNIGELRLGYITPSQSPEVVNKIIDDPKNYHNNDLNNIDNEKETTKKRDTSTKLIELYSNEHSEEETDTDFHKTKPSNKKKKKKTETMQTTEITNQETTEKTPLETDVSIKTKTKRYKAVPMTTPTTSHNDDTTVDLELKKFEKEVRSYLTSKSSTTSEVSSQKITENTDSHHRSVKQKHYKRHKKHNRKHDRTKATTLNLVQLVQKVERLDQVAQKIMTPTTTMPTVTTKKITATRPTPAYPKQEEYRIPDSEFKLSYDPNQKPDFQDYNLMYSQYFKRNQMIQESEDKTQKSNTLGNLSEVIQKILEPRLNNKLLEKTMTEHSSRRQQISSQSTELRNIRGILTNSEEEAMFKIIKAMIDSKKVNELKSATYVKEQKRSTIKAFNIHKMSPEENMADVIHKMVDSSLRMQFEKPQMSISDLAEILKNKYFENQTDPGNNKVSAMIEKIIEKKIQQYAQTTIKTAKTKQYQDKSRLTHQRKERSWPSVRPTHKNIGRAKTTSPSTRYQTQTKTTLQELGRIEFQIPYAEYPRTSITTTKLTKETLRVKPSKKWHKSQHTTSLPAQRSAIKISHGRQGPISIVIEDKESEEVKRPIPEALFLQKQQTTHRIDPRIIVVDNRHIDLQSTKASYWEKDLKTELIKKILREKETTERIATTKSLTHGRHILSSNDKQGNEGDSENNRIRNVQLVFLNVPQLETKENKKQISREIQKTKEGNGKEEEKRQEEERNMREQENKIKENIQEVDSRQNKEKKSEQEKKTQEEKKLEEERRKEEHTLREEKRLEKQRKEIEKNIQEKKKQEEKKLAEEKKIEEKIKREEKKRMEEEIRKEIYRVDNERKALRQKIEKEIKAKEILERKWENELKRKIKENQKAEESVLESKKKVEEAGKKYLLIKEKLKEESDLPVRLKHADEIQTSQSSQSIPSTTLNYWERQWQQDQDAKLREEYNNYMKLYNAGRGLSEKTINYWNEQWRVDLEKKLRQKQKEEYERTKTTNDSKWVNTEISTSFNYMKEVTTDREPSLMEMIKRPSYFKTNAFGDIIEDQEDLQIEQNKAVHYDWRPRANFKQNHMSSERSVFEDVVIKSSAKSKPNRLDARRDDDYSDTIYIMPDGRKRDKLVIKRVHDRSNRVTALENMSKEKTVKNVKLDNSEHTDEKPIKNKYDNDLIESDMIKKKNTIGRRKPKRVKSKKVTAIRLTTNEETENNFNFENTKETILTENEDKSENDESESETVEKSNENLLRMKKGKKVRSKSKKNKNKLVSEETQENDIRTKKKKTNKLHKKYKHQIKNRNKKVDDLKVNEKEENLTKENEHFERKKNKKGERNKKQVKKVKTEEENEQEHKHRHKTKHGKRKHKMNKKNDISEELMDRKQKKSKVKEEDVSKTKLRKEENSKDEDERETKQKKILHDEPTLKLKIKEKDMPKTEKVKKKETKYRKGEKEDEANDDASKEEVEKEKVNIKKKKAKKRKAENFEGDSHQVKKQERKISKEGEGGRELEADIDESKEKVATREKEYKEENKKEKTYKGNSNQIKEKKKKLKNADDGGREFDFQLMIGGKGRGD